MMGSDPRAYAVIGAVMGVHRQRGCGFLEAVYQEAMGIELAARNRPFEPRIDIPGRYKSRVSKALYRPDFLCFEAVVVELSACS